jgi:hypothetical protein
MLLKGAASGRCFEPSKVFDALQSASSAWVGGDDVNLGLWLDGRSAIYDFYRWLASPDDIEAAQYVERVVKESGCSEFCVMMFNLQKYSKEIYRWGTDLSDSFREVRGEPKGEVDIDAILGNYRVTPRGIHRDASDTLMFVIEGEKNMLFWDSSVFEGHPHSRGNAGMETLIGVDAFSHAASSIAINASAGDVIWWPAEFWHVGCNQNVSRSALALNIGFGTQPTRFVNAAFHDVCSAIQNQLLCGEAGRPANVEAVDRALLEFLDSRDLRVALSDIVRQSHLRKSSGSGFLSVASLRGNVSISPKGRFRLTRPQRLRWSLSSNSCEIEVAADGHLHVFPFDNSIIEIINALVGGSVVDIDTSEACDVRKEFISFMVASDVLVEC